jgi:Protein of unknown function (DUF3150)
VPDSSIQPRLDAHEATEVLFNRGILMDLYIGKPTFQKKLSSKDLLLEGVDTKAMYLGHKYLLAKTATETLVSLEGRGRRALADKSLEFPLSGARFVTYTALPDILEEMRTLQNHWRAAVDSLLADYPKLQEEQLAVLDKQCETFMKQKIEATPAIQRGEVTKKLGEWLVAQRRENRALYPPQDKLRLMFHFEWRMFKISSVSGLEQMSTLDQAEVASAQRQLRADLQKWVVDASVEMHKVLGFSAANALRLLDQNGKLNPRNLKPLFDAFETFKAIDFTGASSIQAVVDQMKTTFTQLKSNGDLDYERISETVNRDDKLSNFRELLSRVSELAQDEVAERISSDALRSTGDFKRVIEV